MKKNARIIGIAILTDRHLMYVSSLKSCHGEIAVILRKKEVIEA